MSLGTEVQGSRILHGAPQASQRCDCFRGVRPETPNRYTVEFQDEFNEYQQDSLSLVDVPDAVIAGQEISASMTALGLPNFSQAGRVLRLQLDRRSAAIHLSSSRLVCAASD